jgi:uncharacterized protein (DUF697 family)
VPALDDTKAKQVIKLLLPVLTNVVAGKIAAACTNALGRSAQACFFRGEVRPPAESKEEGDGFASRLEPQNLWRRPRAKKKSAHQRRAGPPIRIP